MRSTTRIGLLVFIFALLAPGIPLRADEEQARRAAEAQARQAEAQASRQAPAAARLAAAKEQLANVEARLAALGAELVNSSRLVQLAQKSGDADTLAKTQESLAIQQEELDKLTAVRDETRKVLSQLAEEGKTAQASSAKKKTSGQTPPTEDAKDEGSTTKNDPFGKPVEPPKDVAETPAGDSSPNASETDATATPPQPPSKVVRLELTDGTTITGTLQVDALSIETRFGVLTVPITKIRRFAPGLSSIPALEARVSGLVERLGGDVFAEREQAHKELANMGLSVRLLLEARANDENPERARHIKLLLEELEQMSEEAIDDAFDEGDQAGTALIRQDTLETTSFTATGKISPRKIQLQSKYGLLEVDLGDVVAGTRDLGEPEDIRKTVSVDGTKLAQRGFVDTGIMLAKGDRVSLRADGTLIMSPWGSNSISLPDGGSNYGWYVPNKIYGGALVGKIGSGEIFKVGASHDLVATAAGKLQLAIAMQQNYANGNYQFPGSYEVRIIVRKSSK